MELKGRLNLISQMTPVCNTVCDVGTDHAYVPIHLLLNDKCNKVIACDIKKGPLIVAQKNIKKYNLEDKIITRQGSGLNPIKEGETDVVIIAGMGGMLVSQLLEEEILKSKAAKTLILQPMNAIEVVRKWLYDNKFSIFDEGLAKEGHKIYNVMAAKYTGDITNKREIDYYIGEQLINKNDPLVEKYVLNKIDQFQKIIYGLEKMKDIDYAAVNYYMGLIEDLKGFLI